MSFFEDQEEDWYANDCKGSPDNYDGAGNYDPTIGTQPEHLKGLSQTPPTRSKSKKRREQRKRAELRKKDTE